MNLLHPIKEYRFRKAFHDWAAGGTRAAAERLLVLGKTDAGAARFLPLALAESGEGEKAMDKAAGIPGLPTAFRGTVLLWAGKPAEAADLLERASRRNPLEQALLGQALLEEGKEEEAARAWDPGGPGPWRILSPRAMAVLLERLHKKEPQELQKRLAADLRGEGPNRPSFPARLFRRLLDPLEMVLPALKGNRFALERIRILSLASRGDWNEAVQRARRLRREFKDMEEAADILLRVLAGAGRDRALLEVGGGGPGRAALDGTALASLWRWEEALPCFEKALEEDPEDLISAYGAACSLALQGRRDDAARKFIRVLALEETAFVEVLNREAECFLRKARAS